MRLAHANKRRMAVAPTCFVAPSNLATSSHHHGATDTGIIHNTGCLGVTAALISSSTTTLRPFKWLTPYKMAERCKQGLYYNYDEPYLCGHKFTRLFFLEVSDYIVEEPDDSDDTLAAPVSEPPPLDLETPMISLSTFTGIRMEVTRQFHVQIDAHEFIALLYFSSMHNFINASAAH